MLCKLGGVFEVYLSNKYEEEENKQTAKSMEQKLLY